MMHAYANMCEATLDGASGLNAGLGRILGMGRQRIIAAMMREGSRSSNRSASRKLPLTSRARRLSEVAVPYNAKRSPEAATPARVTERAEESESAQDEVNDVARGGDHGSAIRRAAQRREERPRFTRRDEKESHRCARPNAKLTGAPAR